MLSQKLHSTPAQLRSGAQSVNGCPLNLPLKLTLLWTLFHDSGHQSSSPKKPHGAPLGPAEPPAPRSAGGSAASQPAAPWLPGNGATRIGPASRDAVASPMEQELRADVHGAAAVFGMVVSQR